MNKLFLPLLAYSALICAEQAAKQFEDCAQPTPYVMGFLKRSKTFFRSSQDWKEKTATDGYAIRTVFAKTHLCDYPGLAAMGYHLSHHSNPWHLVEDSASASFVLENVGNNTISIKSRMVHTEVYPADSDEQAEEYKREVERIREHTAKKNKETQSDDCTTCEYVHKIIYNAARRRAEYTILSNCESKVPVDAFTKAVQE